VLCFSLSLIRTAPLVVGSVWYTAEKSVAAACVRVFASQIYVRMNSSFFKKKSSFTTRL
jgi:hypothetical protein